MKTQGLIAAVPTAFREDGSLDTDAIGPMAEHVGRMGCTGVFVNGTTGESMSLTIDERERTLEAWRRALPTGRKLFAHIGHNCLEDAKRLARHASAHGADAIAAIAPGFFRPVGVEGMATWCARLAAATPETPFYFYYMPALTGTILDVARFLEHAGPRIPNLAGAKYTYETLADFMDALRLDQGRYDLLWGRDEMLLAAWAMGAKAATGSTFALAGPHYLNMIAAFERGELELARTVQARLVAMIRAMAATGNFFAALKQGLRDQGVPIQPTTRLPLADVPVETMDTCRQSVSRLLKQA